MGYRRFGGQIWRNYRAGAKIADDITKMLLLGGAYAATKVYESSKSNVSYPRTSYSPSTPSLKTTSRREPVFKIDFSLLETLENSIVLSLKKELRKAEDDYACIDNQIKNLIQKRNKLIKSIEKLDWIKWLLRKRHMRLEAELQEVQNQISLLTSNQVVAKFDTQKLSTHSNYDKIKEQGEHLFSIGSFVSSKYEYTSLQERYNHREWFYTVFIGRGSLPHSLGKSDCCINLCGGDFTLSFTPFGIVFIIKKAFYIFEYSEVKVSYRTVEMREPDPKFSKDKHNIISYEWEHSTLSGAPDRRYKDNRQLPVVEYGNIHIAIGDFVLDILHPEKNICSQFVHAVNATSNKAYSKSPLKTLNRVQIKKIKTLYHQSKSLKCEEDITTAIEILMKEAQTCNCAHPDSLITQQLANKIQQRCSETKKDALKNIYSRCVQLTSLIETDLNATEILQTFKGSEVNNSSSAGDEVKEKYAVASPDLQIEVKMLFDERKKLLDLILSKECNHITSENSISIDDNDIESKDAMKRIHDIEDEVCNLLKIR